MIMNHTCLNIAQAPAKARRETGLSQPWKHQQPIQASRGFNQSMGIGNWLEASITSMGLVMLTCLSMFEQIGAVNNWDEYMFLVQLHHCLIGDAMSCGRHETMSSTIQDLCAQYSCHVTDASPKPSSSICKGLRTLYELGVEIHRLSDVVFGVGEGESQRIEFFWNL